MAVGDFPTPEEFKNQQRAAWTRSAAPWRKRFAEMSFQSREATRLILEEAEIRPGLRVLDLASGTGEPALSLAEAVTPEGRVTATDLVPEMLAGLAAEAQSRGLTHLDTQSADLEALPFPDEQFDAVTCRFGIMFCPNAVQALREVRRVLRLGGRAAFIVWGPSDQPFFAATLGVLTKHLQPPPPPPGAPSPFRFAESGSLSAALVEAGFRTVRESLHTVAWPYPGSPEAAWDYMREVAGVSIPAEIQDQVTAEIIAALRQFYDGQQMDTTAQIIAASGVR